MSFTLTERYQADVLSIKGRFFGSVHRAWVEQVVTDQIATNRLNLIVDLSRVTFIDSTAIGLLIAAAKRLRNAGGDVRLAGLTDRIHGVMLTTRLLGPVFETHATVDEALQRFAAPRSLSTAGA